MQTRQRLTIAVRSALRKQGDVPGSREPPRELVSYFSSFSADAKMSSDQQHSVLVLQ